MPILTVRHKHGLPCLNQTCPLNKEISMVLWYPLLKTGSYHWVHHLLASHHVIILNTISKRQDGSDLFRILHTKSFSKFTEASVYYVIAVCWSHGTILIASCAANYDWPFGTLPFGLFGSNLDTRDLETYPRTYSGHFWNMSIFDDSRAVWVLFRKWVVSENRILLRNRWPIPGYSDLVLGGEVPRLSHGPICFPIQNT